MKSIKVNGLLSAWHRMNIDRDSKECRELDIDVNRP